MMIQSNCLFKLFFCVGIFFPFVNLHSKVVDFHVFSPSEKNEMEKTYIDRGNHAAYDILKDEEKDISERYEALRDLYENGGIN